MSSLPKLATAKFTCKLPSDGTEVVFRPFLVKEEKALLIAAESGETNTVIRAMKDAITACAENVDVAKLPFFDMEYLFLQLRAKSAGEEVRFSYRHKDGVNREGKQCSGVAELVINIDDVNIQKSDSHMTKYKIDDKYGVVMRYPNIDDVEKMNDRGLNEIALMASCIETVYDDDAVYPPESLKDAIEFVESMNAVQYEKFIQFFDTMPKLNHTVNYQCPKCGQEDTVRFEGVADFF